VIDSNVARKVKLEASRRREGLGLVAHAAARPDGSGHVPEAARNKGEIIMGSANVFYEGKAAAVLGGTANMCADPSRRARRQGDGQREERARRRRRCGQAMRTRAASAASLLARSGERTDPRLDAVRHPINVANGELVITAADFSLESVLPIEFVRTYLSTSSQKDGPLGFGWFAQLRGVDRSRSIPGTRSGARSHAQFEESGEPSPTGGYVVYCDTNGVATTYHARTKASRSSTRSAKRTLRLAGGAYTVAHRSGLETRFGPWPQARCHPLPAALVDRNGNTTRFFYEVRVSSSA
jgi:hypothetical protein